MIELIGPEDSNEFIAAQQIAHQLNLFWPGIKDSPTSEDNIKIISSAKISGYQISDIDLIVIANFRRARRFIPKRPIKDSNGNFISGKPINLDNFIITIEVKDHTPENINIQGDNILVAYSRGPNRWKSATDQNINQVHSLRNYLLDSTGNDYFIHRMVYLRNVDGEGENFLGNNFDGLDFLTVMVSLSKVRFYKSQYHFNSSSNLSISEVFNDPLFKKIIPSNLDRFKMDKIFSKHENTEEIAKNLGIKPIVLRGHGGSGKTIMFLQAAWQAYENFGKRILVLTYNVALAADIKRLLMLMNISSDDDSCINVETIYSHMYKLFHNFNLIESGEEINYKDYEKYSNQLKEYLNKNQSNFANSENYYFDYDAVVIDESQDWPDFEISVIKQIYGNEKISISDGINQLIRGSKANWFNNIEPNKLLQITLKKSLRMKRNLGLFVKDFAELTHLPISIEPNETSGGGKVIILNKSYENFNDLHNELLKNQNNLGNSNIDALFCSHSYETYKNIFKDDVIWNGFDENVRKDFPRDISQFRILHYESIRGLEGWTVVLDELDLYFDNLINSGLSYNQAINRISIALTRPIDTLVISLKNNQSEFSKLILDIAKKNIDFIERIDE